METSEQAKSRGATAVSALWLPIPLIFKILLEHFFAKSIYYYPEFLFRTYYYLLNVALIT